MDTVHDIFEVWDSVSEMASALDQKADTVFRWRKKGRIPVDMWPRLIETAARREVLITATQLMNLHRGAPQRGRPRKAAHA
jgi:hypothetical protein